MVKQSIQPGGRYALLDELRGLDLISMMFFHGMWDLVFLFGLPVQWYQDKPGYIWQQTICWIFILLSGFCVPLGHKTAQRGAEVFGAGALVTLVTWALMPADLVLFGVLTFLGSAMLLTALVRPLLDRVPAGVGLAVSAALFFLTRNVNQGFLGFEGLLLAPVPAGFYANTLTAFLGFPQPGFYSTDYFSLIPWLFLFWAGFFLHKVVGRENMEPLRCSVCPPLGWMGRHSLLLYLLHQPVIYGLLMAGAYLASR